jgi:Yip1 domain
MEIGLTTNTHSYFSSLFSIWTKPRTTIRSIVDTDPERWVWVLIAVAGAAQSLDRASGRDLGDRLPAVAIVAIALLLAPVGAAFGAFVFSKVLRWTGKRLGGRADEREILASLAWASVPFVAALVLWIPKLAIFGSELFTAEMPRLEQSFGLAMLLLGFGFIDVVLGAWAGLILVKCLAEIQGFSAWRGFANALLAWFVVIVPLAVIAIIGATIVR